MAWTNSPTVSIATRTPAPPSGASLSSPRCSGIPPTRRLAVLRRIPVLRRLVGIEAEEQVPHYSYPKWSRTADGI